MKIAILDRRTLGNDIDLSGLSAFGEVEYFEAIGQDEIEEKLSDKDILITNKVELNRDNLKNLDKLKLICLTATGYNNIDIEYTYSRGITVCNVAGYSTDSVVQHTFTMILYLLSKINKKDDFVKRGDYGRGQNFTNLDNPFMELAEKNWGIIGLGNIGSRVADIASSFGARLSYYSTSGRNRESDYRRVGLDKLLAESDIISIHCPLNEKTENLIDMDALRQMKKSAILINVARGGIIVEKDLVRALNEGIIGGACLDVFETEPLQSDSPIYLIDDKERVVLTPHVAWGSIEARKRLVEEIEKNVGAFLDGSPRNVVKPIW